MLPTDSMNYSPASFTADRMAAEGALWPWIHRFFWEPAKDLHPQRRVMVAPILQERDWEDVRTLGYVSRHLVDQIGKPDPFEWDSRSFGFRLALLPSAPLSRLARLMGLAITGCPVDPDDEDADFAMERARLYWHRDGEESSTTACKQSGWRALREVVAGQPRPIGQRFEWKTPPDDGYLSSDCEDAEAQRALARRVLRELEEPWCNLFVTSVR